MKKVCVLFVLSIVLIGCYSGANKNVVKSDYVNDLVEKDTFKIFSEFAIPLNATTATSNLMTIDNQSGQVNLQSKNNYFKKNGENLAIDLPYFGEKQLSSTYDGSSNDIAFNGKPTSTKHSYNAKKGIHTYQFRVNTSIERLNIRLTIYQNLNTRLKITSSHRTAITYTGKIEKE